MSNVFNGLIIPTLLFSLLPFNSLKGRLNFDLTLFRDRGSSNKNFQDDKVGLSNEHFQSLNENSFCVGLKSKKATP